MNLPTISECVEYGRSIRLRAEDSEHFFDYFESNGWKVGRNPMKSWQAAMRNWKRNQQRYGNEYTDTSTYLASTREALGLPGVVGNDSGKAADSAWSALGLDKDTRTGSDAR